MKAALIKNKIAAFSMDYDILILGGGVIGCAVAYQLSKYNINIALIEKDYDVVNDVTFVNTAVVYDGTETVNPLISSLEETGSRLIEEDCKKFKVYYKKCSTVRITDNDETEKNIDELVKRAEKNKLTTLKKLTKSDLNEIEKYTLKKVKSGIFCTNTAVINPYDLALSYGEVAADNGVKFKLEEKVINIKKIPQGFRVTTNKNKFKCKFVVDTIPGEIFAQKNTVREESKKMAYFLLSKNVKSSSDHIILKELKDNRFVLRLHTPSGQTVIGIKNYKGISMDEAVEIIREIYPSVKSSDIEHVFMETYSGDNNFIKISNLEEGYLKVRGSYYSKISIAPAVALEIKNILETKLNITKKNNYADKRHETFKFNCSTDKEKNEHIKFDEKYGKVICDMNVPTQAHVF